VKRLMKFRGTRIWRENKTTNRASDGLFFLVSGFIRGELKVFSQNLLSHFLQTLLCCLTNTRHRGQSIDISHLPDTWLGDYFLADSVDKFNRIYRLLSLEEEKAWYIETNRGEHLWFPFLIAQRLELLLDRGFDVIY
jgi:hypothetical protein